MTGDAQAKVIQQVGASVAANPTVIPFEAAHRWNGQLPATMLGGAAAPLAMFDISREQQTETARPTAAGLAQRVTPDANGLERSN